jgi:4'-phosphopantetheinyl transferase
MIEQPTWGPAPAALLPPQRGEIHLWLVHQGDGTRGERAVREGILDPEEIARMRRYIQEKHRERFAARRTALRSILGRYLDVAPGGVRFHYAPRGKPALEPRAHPLDLEFNVSDSEDLALIGIARGRRIGVDIERVRPVKEMAAIAESHFAAEEREVFRSLSDATGTGPSARVLGFYNAWTRKEAWLKARGDGLWAPLDGFAVTLAPGESPRLIDVRGEPGESARWSFLALEAAAGFLASVAVEAVGVPGGPVRTSFFFFDPTPA